ncbi:PIG-L family deacetylase [archaeon]|jgi:N-acetylglucosamine malate deacetylase 1|nr:PIG-L family deacetylase [archaeon]
MKQESVLFLIAHNDDQLLGAGGTIAKYAKEGKKVITIIFSFGESSQPFIQDHHTRKVRVKESKRAQKILGEEELYYLGLTETKFPEEIKQRDIHTKIKNIIKKNKPSKIFTHSMDDPHPDHRAVYNFVMNLVEKINFKGNIYSFNIWNYFINFRQRNQPKLVVDISDTFKIKVEAFKKHKSQFNTIIMHMWYVYFQAFLQGLMHGVKCAEVFYKLK